MCVCVFVCVLVCVCVCVCECESLQTQVQVDCLDSPIRCKQILTSGQGQKCTHLLLILPHDHNNQLVCLHFTTLN